MSAHETLRADRAFQPQIFVRRVVDCVRGGINSGTDALPAHLQSQPAFRAAMRHSRRVRWLRRAIPLACGMAGLFLIMRLFADMVPGLPAGASVEKLTIEDRKLVMDKPRLSGFKRDGRAYELTAITAIQDLRIPNLIALNTLTARMQTSGDGTANLTSKHGIYDSKSERLDVDGDVRVRTETGLDARLIDARIELKAGTVLTEKPVEVRMPQGQVNADRMQVLDNGRQIVFEGNVRSIFVNAQPRDNAGPQQPLESAIPQGEN